MINKEPNIIFISTDTQSKDMLSFYSDRYGVETPELDRLAEQSICFNNAFTPCPLCTPARSSWYTGLYPNRNGCITNDISVGRSIKMLPEYLHDLGYDTFHIGKWHLDAAGYNGGGVGDGGFNSAEWYDLTNFYDEVGRGGINKFGGWNKGLYNEEFCFGHRITERAINLMRSQKHNRPFFLSVSFDEPHGPYICPPPFRGKFDQDKIKPPRSFFDSLESKPRIQKEYALFLSEKRKSESEFPLYYHRYYDCNSFVDYEIGRILKAIDDYLDENMIVLFSSDHGDHQGHFGLTAKGPTMYDTTIAVPLFIRLQDKQKKDVNIPVSTVSLLPTILDLAGADFGNLAGFHGETLLEVDTEVTADDPAVFIEYNRFAEHLDQDDGFFPIRCIRTKDWKLSINLFDSDELYHIETDHEERTNLINDSKYRNVLHSLHDRLLVWQKDTNDLFRGPVWYDRPWRPGYRPQFEGLMTTGYKDEWEFGSLHEG